MSQTESNPTKNAPNAELPSHDREAAKVARTPDGEVVGVAIYLTAADLRDYGLIPNGVRAVVPQVANGTVHIEPVR